MERLHGWPMGAVTTVCELQQAPTYVVAWAIRVLSQGPQLTPTLGVPSTPPGLQPVCAETADLVEKATTVCTGASNMHTDCVLV